ncbi:PepSY domain-containing protein, partial [Nocardioides cavernae]|nr:PepSY domain-containing protein [Nocardioides cavernae]
ILIAATFAMTAMANAPAFADEPGRGWISNARVTTMLAQRGYRVTKMEADDGHWEGETARRTAMYEFHVDPHNGKVTKLERDRD